MIEAKYGGPGFGYNVIPSDRFVHIEPDHPLSIQYPSDFTPEVDSCKPGLDVHWYDLSGTQPVSLPDFDLLAPYQSNVIE
jgi:hypothetical protein